MGMGRNSTWQLCPVQPVRGRGGQIPGSKRDTEEGKESGAGCGWFMELATGLTTVGIFRDIWYCAKASLFLSAFGLEDRWKSSPPQPPS